MNKTKMEDRYRSYAIRKVMETVKPGAKLNRFEIEFYRKCRKIINKCHVLSIIAPWFLPKLTNTIKCPKIKQPFNWVPVTKKKFLNNYYIDIKWSLRPKPGCCPTDQQYHDKTDEIINRVYNRHKFIIQSRNIIVMLLLIIVVEICLVNL